MLLVPEYVFQDITCITHEFLVQQGVNTLVLDIDNTLALHDNPVIRDDIAKWLDLMREKGIRLIIASNNEKNRVAIFAEYNALPYVYNAHKPLSKGFLQAQKHFGVEKSQMAIVGDQLFTDRLGAAIFGCKAFVTLPLGPETKWYIKCKRVLEKPFFAIYKGRKGVVSK